MIIINIVFLFSGKLKGLSLGQTIIYFTVLSLIFFISFPLSNYFSIGKFERELKRAMSVHYSDILEENIEK